MLNGDDNVSIPVGVGFGSGVGLGLVIATALEDSRNPTNASVIMMMPTLVMQWIRDTALHPVLETHGCFRNLK
ncbi:MAG: hypothetical protein HKL84_03745 [Acidimicrobiaceae bacterium]|nr:hypothetical protein [Acidimicrobiaceae bacterium]